MNRIKTFKILIAIAVTLLLIAITIYLFPLVKDLATPEGQIQFKQKIDNTGALRIIIIIWITICTNLFIYHTRRTIRNICRNVLWSNMGNGIYNVVMLYDFKHNIFYCKKIW